MAGSLGKSNQVIDHPPSPALDPNNNPPYHSGCTFYQSYHPVIGERAL